jgi:hypothetical protein
MNLDKSPQIKRAILRSAANGVRTAALHRRHDPLDRRSGTGVA